jgi:GTP-binding protein
MHIESAVFLKSVMGTNESLSNGIPQVAIVGRSNVGKSSLINAVAGQKGLAITSSFPGRTQAINIFLINNNRYLVDLPGYGFAKLSLKERERIQKMMYWYLMDSDCEQEKILVIIDANVGPTKIDMEVLQSLEAANKNIVVIANKIDKIKKAQYKEQMQRIQDVVGHKVIPCSAKNNIGMSELAKEILG